MRIVDCFQRSLEEFIPKLLRNYDFVGFRFKTMMLRIFSWWFVTALLRMGRCCTKYTLWESTPGGRFQHSSRCIPDTETRSRKAGSFHFFLENTSKPFWYKILVNKKRRLGLCIALPQFFQPPTIKNAAVREIRSGASFFRDQGQ